MTGPEEKDEAELETPVYLQSEETLSARLEQIKETGSAADVKKFLKDLYPADIARIVLEAGVEEGGSILDRLDAETRGEVLLEMEDPDRVRFMEDLTSRELATIVQAQESDEAVDLLSEIDEETVSEVLSHMPLEERINVTELLSYPENSAGSIMAKEFASVRETETVKKAILAFRKASLEAEDIHMVFVLDEDGRYIGHIELKKLILANPKSKVKRVMEADLIPIPVEMDREEVANLFAKYNFISVPVVDGKGVMLGRITVDNILDVVQEEASEDILRMSGVGGDETLSTPLFQSSSKRILWLGVNLLTAFMASAVVRLFEDTISKAVVLAALMPIVAGMGGNAAGQTIAIIVRNIALGELTALNAVKAFRRELILGILNGISMGVVTGSVVFLMTGLPALGIVICSAMIANMLVAATAGTAIPVILKMLKIDPAIASTIFVTTCTDVLGFFTFLGLSFLALPYIVAAGGV